MASVDVRKVDGSTAGTVDLPGGVFGITPNMAVMHQVVTAQLAGARAGTQSTKTRAEVRGGGAKPWKQKGTGRARQGSSRSPQWTGGGVAFGPKPRSYKQRTPKKMIQLALRSALSDRAALDHVVVIDTWAFDSPSTKAAVAALKALNVDGKVLVVLGPDDQVARKSFRNLPDAHVLLASELNAYDVLCSDWVVFTSDTLPTGRHEQAVAPAEADAPVDAPAETQVETQVETQAEAPSEGPAPDADADGSDAE